MASMTTTVQEVTADRITYPGGLLDGLIGFEAGTLQEDELIDLMQHLADTGLAWQLGGDYKLAADELIDRGLVRTDTESHECALNCMCRVPAAEWDDDDE